MYSSLDILLSAGWAKALMVTRRRHKVNPCSLMLFVVVCGPDYGRLLTMVTKIVNNYNRKEANLNNINGYREMKKC